MAVTFLEGLLRFKIENQAVQNPCSYTGNTARKSWEKTHYKGIRTWKLL